MVSDDAAREVGAVSGAYDQFCHQTGPTIELHDGKLTHFAVDPLGNWKPSKIRGYGQDKVSLKLCDTAYTTLHLASPGVGRMVLVEACVTAGL